MQESLSNDFIQLRLPLKPEYLTVLRVTVGAVAGTMGFNYDELTQLRIAISEVFDLAVTHAMRQGPTSESDELVVGFFPQSDQLEIRITQPAALIGNLETEMNEEGRALLESLLDKVEFGGEATLVRMVKCKSIRTA